MILYAVIRNEKFSFDELYHSKEAAERAIAADIVEWQSCAYTRNDYDIREFKLEPQRVYLFVDNRYQHSRGCLCEDCDSQNISYGCGIFMIGYSDPPLARVYAPSPTEAYQLAHKTAVEKGYVVEDWK